MSQDTLTENKGSSLADALSVSRIFRDYEAAFTKASGLPLVLREPRARKDAPPWPNHNSFCALMGRNSETCAACYDLQCRLEKEAVTQPCTLTCFAGLCETAVPVRIGEQIVAFLETGHVFLEKPRHSRFNKVAQTLLRWGADVDLKRAEEAWLATTVLSPVQYEGFVHMLAIFAQHLKECGNALALEAAHSEEAAVRKARKFILAHSSDDLTLAEVARVVNLSAHHFCKKFKHGTGIAFTEFVARVRVEKARHLLQEPSLRIGEIAFKAGFQSLSQFNRVFHRLTGQSPSECRKTVAASSADAAEDDWPRLEQISSGERRGLP